MAKSQNPKNASRGEPNPSEHIFLAAIFESSDDAIIGQSLDSIVRSWNKSAEKMYGYTADEMIGKSITVIIPPDHQEEESTIIEKIRKGERIYHMETVRYRKDGSQIDVSISVSPLIDDSGTIIGAVKIARDISAGKKAQVDLLEHQALLNELRQSKEQLERSNTELQRFAYVAAHDLKEPLRTIVSYTNLLNDELKGKLSKDAEENMSFIVDAGKRMQQLISDVMAYSRVETQAQPLEPIDCNDIFDHTVMELMTVIKESGASVTRDDLPTITADASQIPLLMINLLGNALKFRGEAAPKIHVSVKSDDNMWLFSVKDNGLGIDMRFADRIFQMFQRLHGINEYPGTGIGLALCKKIVERHKGKIWVESQHGLGSTFYFTLPQTP